MSRPEPEWTEENKNKKQGDTTFQTCGWCEHVGCGSRRYDCHLESKCSLMKSYSEDVNWDDKCKIKNLGHADFESIINSKDYDIKESKERILRIQKQIDIMKKLKADSENSPPLPASRKCDYYTIGDQLYVFHEKKWNAGTCVAGYRHQDGCVSYVLDDYPDSKVGWGCGYAVPCVLKAWEFDYFCNNRDAFDIWLTLSDKDYNGEKLDLKAYAEALI